VLLNKEADKTLLHSPIHLYPNKTTFNYSWIYVVLIV